jgi:hypothetical protein
VPKGVRCHRLARLLLRKAPQGIGRHVDLVGPNNIVLRFPTRTCRNNSGERRSGSSTRKLWIMPNTSMSLSSLLSQRPRRVIGCSPGATAWMRGKTFLGMLNLARSTRSI